MIVLCVVGLLLGVASGQLQCRDLQVANEGDAMSGASLTRCQTDQLQCCVQSYIDRAFSELNSSLIDSLGDEIGDFAESRVRGILNDLGQYFQDDFLASIRDDFPASDVLALVGENINDLTSDLANFLQVVNFEISVSSPEVNTTEIFLSILTRIENLIMNSRSPLLTSGLKTCIVEQIQMGINRTSLQILGRTLEVARRSFTGVSRLLNFIDRFDDDFEDLRINLPPTCLREFFRIGFCGRCSRSVPPVCSNTCNAVVRACFAGFRDGLLDEFENAWTVLRRLIRLADTSIRELFSSERELLTVTFGEVATRCGLPSLPGRKRRQNSDNFIPTDIINRIQDLAGSGPFMYNDVGPRFCRPDSDEVDFCAGRRDSEREVCEEDDICTSTCRCWDGEEMRTDDTEGFDGVTIEQQARNPVIDIPEDELVEFAMSLGTPVTSFLQSSEFQEIAPEGLETPDPAPFGRGFALAASVLTLLGSLLLYALVL